MKITIVATFLICGLTGYASAGNSYRSAEGTADGFDFVAVNDNDHVKVTSTGGPCSALGMPRVEAVDGFDAVQKGTWNTNYYLTGTLQDESGDIQVPIYPSINFKANAANSKKLALKTPKGDPEKAYLDKEAKVAECLANHRGQYVAAFGQWMNANMQLCTDCFEGARRQKIYAPVPAPAPVQSNVAQYKPRPDKWDEDEEYNNGGGDDDITMGQAMQIIAGAVVNSSNKKLSNSNSHATVDTASRSSAVAIQKAMPSQYNVASADTNSGQYNQVQTTTSTPYVYDSTYNQCVQYGPHDTLRAYKQFRNTCAFSVSVLRCSVDKNGRDNCAARIFGSFELSAGETNIAEGGDREMKWIVCKLPFRAIGAKVSSANGNLTAPCQRNR
jgi:hypothetical protein